MHLSADEVHELLQPPKSNTKRFQESVPIFKDRMVIGRRPIPKVLKDQALNLDQITRRKGVIFLPPFTMTVPSDPSRSLMITDLGVVEDPTRTFNPCTGTGTAMGKWTFGHLMSEMANKAQTGIDPSDFVRKWLENWMSTQTVNGDSVAARTQIENVIIKPWEAASGVAAGGKLDLAKAPFRLLAIVNRLDLRSNGAYGGGTAGEARFVFCAMDPQCNPLQFTVIFEYGVPISGCRKVRAWAQKWADLTNFNPGTANYNDRLQAITDVFSSAGANPAKPNGSALNQLRTDEIALAGPWELREFTLKNPGSSFLIEDTVKQNPIPGLNRHPIIKDYVDTHQSSLLSDTDVVPLNFNGQDFLGGHSLNNQDFWDSRSVSGTPAEIMNAEARFRFSKNTCDGCHGAETNTGFTMVHPAPFGSQAGLAGFLTGITVTDPATPLPPGPWPASRTFNDLARRQQDLDQLANRICLFQIFFRPLKQVH